MCRSTLFFFSQAFVCASGKSGVEGVLKSEEERENFSD